MQLKRLVVPTHDDSDTKDNEIFSNKKTWRSSTKTERKYNKELRILN